MEKPGWRPESSSVGPIKQFSRDVKIREHDYSAANYQNKMERLAEYYKELSKQKQLLAKRSLVKNLFDNSGYKKVQDNINRLEVEIHKLESWKNQRDKSFLKERAILFDLRKRRDQFREGLGLLGKIEPSPGSHEAKKLEELNAMVLAQESKLGLTSNKEIKFSVDTEDLGTSEDIFANVNFSNNKQYVAENETSPLFVKNEQMPEEVDSRPLNSDININEGVGPVVDNIEVLSSSENDESEKINIKEGDRHGTPAIVGPSEDSRIKEMEAARNDLREIFDKTLTEDGSRKSSKDVLPQSVEFYNALIERSLSPEQIRELENSYSEARWVRAWLEDCNNSMVRSGIPKHITWYERLIHKKRAKKLEYLQTPREVSNALENSKSEVEKIEKNLIEARENQAEIRQALIDLENKHTDLLRAGYAPTDPEAKEIDRWVANLLRALSYGNDKVSLAA